MSADKKFMSLALGLVILVGFVFWFSSNKTDDDNLRTSDPSIQSDSNQNSDQPRRVDDTAGLPKSEPAINLEESIPELIDLDQVDRNLDLFGRITNKKGEAVAGAMVRAVKRPWLRGSGLYRPVDEGPIELAQTTSSRDGLYSIRLRFGEMVALEVSAEGFGTKEIAGCQPGQRKDVTLEAEAKLAIQCLSPTGRAMAGVELQLLDISGVSPVSERHAVTDDEGRYLFSGLSAGSYHAVCIQTTYGNPGSQQVKLEAGKTAHLEIRCPDVPDLVGYVRDAETRAAVKGARVGTDWTMTCSATTDETGFYRIPLKRKRAEGDEFRSAIQVHVTAEGYARHQATLPEEGTLDFELERADTVKGRLVSRKARPIAAAIVQVVGSRDVEREQHIDCGGTLSAEDGSFSIANLRRDMSHTVIVLAEGHGRYLLDFDPHANGPGIIDLGDIAIPQARMIAGRVVDNSGTGVAQLRVELRGCNADRGRLRSGEDPAGFDFYGQIEERLTDDLGRFRFNDLAAGSYHIVVQVEGSSTQECDVDLLEDQDREDLEFRLESDSSLRFLCLGPDGPVSGVRIWLKRKSDRRQADSIRSDSEGRVEARFLSDEIYEASFWCGGELAAPSPFELRPRGQEVEVRLYRPALIEGHLVATDGTEPDRYLIHASWGDGEKASTVSEVDGAFNFKVPVGQTVSIRVEGKRRNADGRSYAFPAGTTYKGFMEILAPARGIEFSISPQASDRVLQVLVVDPAGAPVSGAEVSAWPPFVKGRTDELGQVAFEGLAPHEMNLHAKPPESQINGWQLYRSANLKVVPGEERVTLHLRPARLLTGRVVDAQSRGCADAMVDCAASDGSGNSVHTDEEGRFRISMLEVGPWTLSARSLAEDGLVSESTSVSDPSVAIKLVLK